MIFKEFLTTTLETVKKRLEVEINNTVSMKEREDILKRAKNYGFVVLYSKDKSHYIIIDRYERDNKMVQGQYDDITGYI